MNETIRQNIRLYKYNILNAKSGEGFIDYLN